MKHLYAMWLGVSLAIVDIHWYEWEFYVVLIPTIILVNTFNQKYQDQ